MTQPHQTTDKTNQVSRRRFMAGVGAAAAAATVVRPEQVRAYSANAKVRFGIIGCGGRGSWITDLFNQHGGYEVAAAADYFQDRVDGVGGRFNLKPDSRYTGLFGYRRMIEREKLDAIVVESPPYFHPEQAAAGVEAGCHVYVAKPIAVDVPGCLSIEQSGKRATEKGLSFLIDFQTRADEFYIEALKRVHDGAIGKFAFGESTYHAGIPWGGQIAAAAGSDNPENRLRAWGLDRVLSGDIITEQNIHTLDVVNWIMGAPPVCAYGTGGQKVRDFGTCWDTFSVTYQYPDDVGIAFSSRQFDGYGTQPEGIRNRMFGTDGVLETAYGGNCMIRGKNFYRGGSSPGIYKAGVVNNIAAFHAAITSGDATNPTVGESVRSNLLTILGRTAAYEHRIVTWEELLASDEKLQADFAGLKE